MFNIEKYIIKTNNIYILLNEFIYIILIYKFYNTKQNFILNYKILKFVKI